MTRRMRKLVLTTHITSSVGWLGAVAVFLALGVVGMTAQDARTVRGAYLAMAPAAWYVVVPLALASLVTGLVQSLGTTWGLFRHYWVLFKFLINLAAITVLLMYTQTLNYLSGVAAQTTISSDDFGVLRTPSVVLHSILALLLLLVATVLAVYKPRGLTPHGQRRVSQS
jgi:hypothetical protein